MPLTKRAGYVSRNTRRTKIARSIAHAAKLGAIFTDKLREHRCSDFAARRANANPVRSENPSLLAHSLRIYTAYTQRQTCYRWGAVAPGRKPGRNETPRSG